MGELAVDRAFASQLKYEGGVGWARTKGSWSGSGSRSHHPLGWLHAVRVPIAKSGMRGSASPCQTAYKARNERQMKIRGLHEEDEAERRTFRVRHLSFGISRLHSSLLYSFDRCPYGRPEGGFDKSCIHEWS
jgi:hypothetical protein